ncbi:MAG: hypothetical protein K8R02_01065 [Anaerohalosphaeraceae bacterium]|nr:hypothetical protein [Anaerohalosphaeraceae bacterium]
MNDKQNISHQSQTISANDKQILRSLAGRVAELAGRDTEQEKKQLWTKHNDLDGRTQPLVFCHPENGWHEIIPDNRLECASQLARNWEFRLHKEIFWGEGVFTRAAFSTKLQAQLFISEFVAAVESVGDKS